MSQKFSKTSSQPQTKRSSSYLTARDLFLSHHWTRYLPFELESFSGFQCGRILSKQQNDLTIDVSFPEEAIRSFEVIKWNLLSLREPKAAEAAPPVHEVLVVGDWVGVDAKGFVVLFAPCSHFGATVLEEAEEFQKKAQNWAKFIDGVRRFFTDRSFVEMATPTLVPSPGTEPFLDPLSVATEFNGASKNKFLITSPEFHLKKALAAGLPRVFEIAKCFRNREMGEHHQLEFHMLEWYRSFASLNEIADDVEALIQAVASDESQSRSLKLEKVTMAELFREFAEFNLESSSTRNDLERVAIHLRVRFTDQDDFDDLFHLIFLNVIEPKIAVKSEAGPILISGFPPSQAALSRLDPHGFADRFEIYWRGMELCNAFHELNDPGENRQRFEKDLSEREQRQKQPVPLDQELIKNFEHGVPPAGGIALGLERLFMAAHGVSKISSVRPFLSSQ